MWPAKTHVAELNLATTDEQMRMFDHFPVHARLCNEHAAVLPLWNWKSAKVNSTLKKIKRKTTAGGGVNSNPTTFSWMLTNEVMKTRPFQVNGSHSRRLTLSFFSPLAGLADNLVNCWNLLTNVSGSLDFLASSILYEHHEMKNPPLDERVEFQPGVLCQLNWRHRAHWADC